ncbi:MAG: hypothetical protein ACXVHC_07380 [Frankiaceae bacterium]
MRGLGAKQRAALVTEFDSDTAKAAAGS